MIPLLTQHLADVARVCAEYDVKRLELFGSAASGTFADGSDLDFFVEFNSYTSPTLADHWFGLQEDLEALLGVTVDLVSTRMATNPYFLEVANRNREVVYAA